MLRSLGRVALAAAVLLLAGWGTARAQVGDAEVVFGMVEPFSGAAKEMGKEVRTGIEVAFAAQNEAGGVHGRKLRLVAVDDGFEPARTAAAMRELVEVRKVFGILGNVGTAAAEVAARLLIEGLQRTGRALTADALIDALEGIRGLDLGLGTPLGFGPSEHQASRMVWGTVLEAKGALTTLDLL